MRACKKAKIARFKRLAGFFVFHLSFFIFLIPLAADSGSLSMPSISAPSMPTISNPTIGSSFYMPGSNDFFNGSKKSASSSNTKTSDSQPRNSSLTENSSDANSALVKSQSDSNQQISTKSSENKITTAAKVATKAASSFNGLSASDISSLDSLGLLGSFSSLLGNGKNIFTEDNSAKTTAMASSADSALLRQILNELNELKTEVQAQKNGKLTSTPNLASAAKINDPKILRFTVNGYDVLSTCKKIYFSRQESDGTFLLTGDRIYTANSTQRTETFYMLFKATASKGGVTSYTVTPAVIQDYENKYSFLYELAERGNLTANRTGNLVTMRINDSNWKMDVLLAMDDNR